MSRIRTIKPEFWTSEQVVECSPTARLLFIGFWNFADDNGVLPASAKHVKMLVFPGDDFTVAHVQGFINELLGQGLLAEFNGPDGRPYWFVTGWRKHQKIEKPSNKYPAPPAEINNSTTVPRPFNDHSPTVPRPFAEELPTERSGEERSGEERNGEELERSGEERTRARKPPAALISPDWQPGQPALDILNHHGIPEQFSRECLPEFRLYWTERGEKRPGWDACFVNSVKRSWERRPGQSPPASKQDRIAAQSAKAIEEWLARDSPPAIDGEVLHVAH